MVQYVTKDHPGKWLLRKWFIFPGQREPAPDCEHQEADSLEEIRKKVPFGCVMLQRDQHDDPVIQEVWL